MGQPEGSRNRHYLLIEAPLGKLEGGSFNADPERISKTLETERLSLWEFWEGNMEGGIDYWGS